VAFLPRDLPKSPPLLEERLHSVSYLAQPHLHPVARIIHRQDHTLQTSHLMRSYLLGTIPDMTVSQTRKAWQNLSVMRPLVLSYVLCHRSEITILTVCSFGMATSRLSDPLRSSSTRSLQSHVPSHWMSHMRMLLSMHCILGLRSLFATAVIPEVQASATIDRVHIPKCALLATQGHHPYHLRS
jgi:hypothetical protein